MINHISKTNPTYVNGESLTHSVTLSSGDKINIGEREFIYELCSPSELKKESSKKESKDIIPTVNHRLTSPLRNAINSRKETMESSSKPPLSIQGSVLRTPLRLAIQSRRKSGEEVKDIDQNRITVSNNAAAVATTATNSTGRPNYAKINTPLRNAIHAKLCKNEQPTTISNRVVLKTPLRNAIHSKRVYKTEESNLESVSKTIPKSSTLFTSHTNTQTSINTTQPNLSSQLRDAINARRKSTGPEYMKSSHLSTPIKNAIRARKENMEKVKTPNDSKVEAISHSKPELGRLAPITMMLKTPIRKAIQAKRKSYQGEIKTIPDSYIRCIAQSPRRDIQSLKTPLRKAIEARRKSYVTKSSVEQEFNLVGAVINATCTELAVQGYSQEMQLQEDIPSNEADSKAVETFYQSPSKFHHHNHISATYISEPAITTVDTTTSIETETMEFVSMDKSNDMEMVEKNIYSQEELISSLTDVDMELIEIYAEKLESFEENLSSEESHTMAMDAYVRGIETYHHHRHYDDKGEDDMKLSDTRIDDKIDFSYGKSLREMFKLPIEYMSAYDDDRDMELVEKYAMEITLCSGVCENIAYGIALDTFIADPIYFRHHIGGLAMIEFPISDITYQGSLKTMNKDVTMKSIEIVASTPQKMIPNTMESELSTARRSSLSRRSAQREYVEIESPFSARKVVVKTPIKTSSTIPIEVLTNVIESQVTNHTILPDVEQLQTSIEAITTTDSATTKSSKPSVVKSNKSIKSSIKMDSMTEISETTVIDSTNHVVEDIMTAAKDDNSSNDNNDANLDESLSSTVQSSVKIDTKPRNGKRSREVKEVSLSVDEISATPVNKRSRRQVSSNTKPNESSATKQLAVVAGAVSKASTPVVEVISKDALTEKKPKSSTKRKTAPLTTPITMAVTGLSNDQDQGSVKLEARKRKFVDAVVVEPIIKELEAVVEEEEVTVILCDGCDDEFFLDDIGMKSVPEGDWFCDKCTATKKNKAKVPSTKRSRVDKDVKDMKSSEIVVENDVSETRRSTRRK